MKIKYLFNINGNEVELTDLEPKAIGSLFEHTYNALDLGTAGEFEISLRKVYCARSEEETLEQPQITVDKLKKVI